MSLSPETRASYISVIDGILAVSDLEKISAKQIRNGLQNAVDHDISPYKDVIKDVIMERFDEFHRRALANTADASQEVNTAPSVNGVGDSGPSKVKNDVSKSPPPKRESPSDGPSDFSDSASPPKKKVKKIPGISDEKLAAKLQAEENNRRRSTRGGGSTRKRASQPKSQRKRNKSSNKVKADDDSEVDSEAGEAKEKKRTGAFHKELILSTPLAELVGETKLSRPQTVKRIWAYVKENDLQNPGDKRQIRCDDAMRAVFKQDTVHMFTMNKILAQHLYEQDE